jgi:general nucleoside transport system permease protein
LNILKPSPSKWLKEFRSGLKHVKWRGLISAAGAFFLSLVIGSIFLSLNGFNPLIAFREIFIGAFGNRFAIAETLLKTTPLIFTGLSVAIAFQAGLFNIGAEGQLLVGALAAGMVGSFDLGLPPVLHVSLALLAAAVVGGAWGSIAGFIKQRFGAHEVIVTIMMNYIAFLLTSYLVNYPWKAAGMVPQTKSVVESAALPHIIRGSQLSSGLFIAVAIVVVVAILFRSSILGYEMKAVGFNPHASAAGGISPALMGTLSMMLAGAVAGIGGGVEILGVHGRFIQGFSPGFGYDGIAVSVLVNSSPALIPISSVLFGILRAGGSYLERNTSIPGDFTTVIQGLVIFFVAAPRIFEALLKRRTK